MPMSPLDCQIRSAIDQNPYLMGRKVRIETHDGRVTLRGVVHSYYQKQMAQETLRNVAGVDRIENQLEVCWS
jgi:osmotically-inducible protein OsmY